MALALYSKPDENCKLSNTSDDVDDYNPFTTTVDGTTGGVIVERLYVRNDNLDRYYSNIQIYQIGSGDVNDWSQWYWKMMEKDVTPSEEDWAGVEAGNVLTLSDNIGTSTLGDTATYLSFWVRVVTPEKQLAMNITSVSLRMIATETVVE